MVCAQEGPTNQPTTHEVLTNETITNNTNNASQTEEIIQLAVLALLGAITLGSIAAVENGWEASGFSTNTQVQNVL